MCLDGLALWLLGSSCAGRERYLWLDLGLVMQRAKGLDLELDMLTLPSYGSRNGRDAGLAKQLQNQAQDLTLPYPTILWAMGAPTILWP
jgi:hypothetical protein